MTQDLKLKVCAHCGGNAESDYLEREFYVACQNCPSRISVDDKEPNLAIAAWNSRKSEQAILDRVLDEFKQQSEKPELFISFGAIEALKQIIERLK